MKDKIVRTGAEIVDEENTDTGLAPGESTQYRLERLIEAYFRPSTKKSLQERTKDIREEISEALTKCGLELRANGEILATAYPKAPSLLTLVTLSDKGQLVLNTHEGKRVLVILAQSRGIVVPGNLSEPERSYDFNVNLFLDAVADVFELRLEQRRHREAREQRARDPESFSFSDRAPEVPGGPFNPQPVSGPVPPDLELPKAPR